MKISRSRDLDVTASDKCRKHVRNGKKNWPRLLLSALQGPQALHNILWKLSKTDTTGTKDFVHVLCSGVLADHAPSSIVISYDGARLQTMKMILLIIDLSILALRQESGTYLGFIISVGRWYLAPILKAWLSVCYKRSLAIVQAQTGTKLVPVI